MNYGLLTTKPDPRDYSYSRTFGEVWQILPDEYLAGMPEVLDQGLSLFCTAFAACAVASCEDLQTFSPEWFFAQEKYLSGRPLDEGEDLRTPMKVAVKFGFLPAEHAKYSLADKEPVFLANPESWPFSCFLAAAPYKKQRFFRVDGSFEQVRQALWRNRAARRAIFTGVLWRPEWTAAEGGIIPSHYGKDSSLHAIAILGFKKIAGENYLVIQNSYNQGIGNAGRFYVSEAVFNREFDQPMYMLVDLPEGVRPKPLGSLLARLFFALKHLIL